MPEKETRHGVFISHEASDVRIAEYFRDFLRVGLGADYPVYMSGDYRNNDGTPPWTEVARVIQKSALALLIVTPRSVNSRWLNFEAGIAAGAGVPIRPLLALGIGFHDVRAPLWFEDVREVCVMGHFDVLVKELSEIFLGGTWTTREAVESYSGLRRLCDELRGDTSMEFYESRLDWLGIKHDGLKLL